MNKASIAIVVLLALASYAVAEIIYQNDFGTAAQRSVGGGGDWDAEEFIFGSATIHEYENGYAGSASEDLDGDGLHYGLGTHAEGVIMRWVKKLEAPAGQVFENIDITARGYAVGASWGAYFGVALSNDGVNFLSAGLGSGPWWTWPTNLANCSAVGDPAYTGLSEVWIAIIWDNPNAYQWPDDTPNITDVTVTADVVPEPATVGLLAIGCLAAMRRRKN